MTVSGVSPDAIKMIAWSSVPIPLATAAVILRFRARRLIKQVGLDDWFALFALFCYYGLYISLVVWGPVGKVGFAQQDLTYHQVQTYSKVFACVQWFYAWVSPAIKLSVLLLYRRIFVTPWFRWPLGIMATLVLIWWISFCFSLIFACTPVGTSWDPIHAKSCISAQKFCWGNAISNLLLDFIILCLPLPMIWRLHLSTARKISLTLVFALGIFVCVASIFRVTYLWRITPGNVSGTTAIPLIWTSIEPGLGIVCSCLPTLPILFRDWRERRLSQSKSSQVQRWSRLFRLSAHSMSSPPDHSNAFVHSPKVETQMSSGAVPLSNSDPDFRDLNKIMVHNEVRVSLHDTDSEA